MDGPMSFHNQDPTSRSGWCSRWGSTAGCSRGWTAAPRSFEPDLEEGAYDRTPEEEPAEFGLDEIPDG